jgi:hypothetical protein
VASEVWLSVLPVPGVCVWVVMGAFRRHFT